MAAAADLQFAFQDVTCRFQKDSGHNIKLIFGSSGNFFAQIQNGAPFDIFFSADIGYPQKFMAYLKMPEIVSLLKTYGFMVPEQQ